MRYHLIAAADEDGDGARVGALFDDKHLISRSAERNFADHSGFAQLLGREVLEPGDDAAVRRNSNELQAFV